MRITLHKGPWLFLACVALVAIAAGVASYLMLRPSSGSTGASPSSVAAIGHSDPPPRVAEMMTRAGCTGKVIGTQLFARETGRCTLDGAEVTLATFTSDVLRNQWVTAAKSYGGTFVTGHLWAAMCDRPDQAPMLVDRLGGVMA
jgi:hypothetical protein